MKECCKNPDNLYRRENDPEEQPGVTINRCKVCGCRHFEMEAEPGVIGLKGASL